MSRKKVRPLIALSLLAALAACRVEDDGALTASQEFAKLQAEAREAGGIAVQLAPGKEARVEVIDVNSPIYGTGVSVPVKSVPGDASNPVLVIKHLRGYDTSATKDTVHSHVVEVRMIELFGRADIEPAVPVTLFLPFTDSTQIDHFNLHIARFDGALERWSNLKNTFVETSRQRLRGRTTAWGPFMAVEGKQKIVRKTTFYRITQAGKLVCQGELPNDPTTLVSASYLVSGAKTGVLSFTVRKGMDANYNAGFEIATTEILDKPSGEQDVSEKLGEDSKVFISCGSASVVSTVYDRQERSVLLKDWFTAFNYGSAPCQKYAGKNCVTEQGEASVEALFDFTDDSDPERRGQLSIDRPFPDLTWQRL